jgi:hypothetical protein
MATGAAQSYTFYDAKQQSARVSIYVNRAGTIAQQEADGVEFGVAMAGLSNTSLDLSGSVRAKGPYTSTPTPVSPGTAATYQDVADKAMFFFTDAQGQLHRYQIPCPLASIFLADAETVDFTNAAVKQFVADFTHTTFGGTAPIASNAVVSRNGAVLTAAVGGQRRRGKTPRRFSIYTRNPTLTGQGE